MAEETTVNQVESEIIEPEDVDNKTTPSEGLTITKFNQVESELIEPEDVDNKATPVERLTITKVNQVESEIIEPKDVDNKATPSEGLTITKVNQVEFELIEPEDVDNKATPVERSTITEVNQVESVIIEPEDVDSKATPIEGLTITKVNWVESEIIEPEDVDNQATPSEGLTITKVNQVESEIIEPEDVENKATLVERLTITKGPPKVLPRYLSGPQGSCHDLCKYGNPHAKAKPWSAAQKRAIKKERKTQVLGENVMILMIKKSGRSSNSSLLSSKSDDLNDHVDIKEVTNEKTVTSSRKNSPSFEETDVSIELNKRDIRFVKKINKSDIREETSMTSSLPVKERSKNQTKRELVKNKVGFGSSSRKETECKYALVFKNQTKRELVKNKVGFGSSSRKETECRSKYALVFKTKSLSGGNQKSASPSMLLSSKQNLKKPSSSSSKTAKNLRGVSSLEEVKPELANNDNLPDKILHVIQPTSANLSDDPTLASDASKSPSPSPPPSSSKDKSLKWTSKKTSKSGVSASSRKGLKHVGHGTASVTLNHLPSGNKRKINLQQKMQSASRSPSVLSTVSSSNSSMRKQKGATYKYNKARYGNQGENVKVGYKIRPKRTTIVGAANKVILPRKLNFRRGKVIEPQPQNNNIPRRLKFRPVRLLDSDDDRRHVNGTRKRMITGKEVEDGELNAANINTQRVVPKYQTLEGGKNRSFGRKIGVDRSNLCGSKSVSEKIVLRHQKVEGKKQNPRLYNNVIEETATMLAELRKSKVKALVGAFETVISLDSPREGARISLDSPREGTCAPAEVTTFC